MRAQLRFGIVDSVDGGRARVRFPQDNVVSALLPVAQVATAKDKWLQMPVEGDQVAVVTDCNLEDGVIVGAIYSDRDTPSGGLRGVQYQSGAALVFNPATGRWAINSNTESLASVLSDLIGEIVTLTVPTPSGPSGVPVNAPQIAAIQARLNQVLE